MTTTSEIQQANPTDEVDRNIALLAYGLLFFAIFFAGAPALVAVAIAYARRRDVAAPVASHHRFQIFIFWIGFAMTLLAAFSGLAALLSIIGDLFQEVIHGGWTGWDAIEAADLHVGRAFVAFAAAAAVLGALTGVWLLVTSAYGFIRLASNHSIRQTAR